MTDEDYNAVPKGKYSMPTMISSNRVNAIQMSRSSIDDEGTNGTSALRRHSDPPPILTADNSPPAQDITARFLKAAKGGL